ncbi:MAG: transcription termination/antitermination protein NusA [Candidatus Nealsonbacteria bacterium CG18_big_fil_WC_8_21_14_2_50_37_10]|uniref:Transcription termination/antitermination protein NusA n=1 Tax=Candidatus Nealsonbacteria bacterium CG18_big_fil_WC_8_21_14_2_50_37_10 TaxID=1974717 RepID=A0A2H0FDR3_9BACT|nr:MAG: transcription termination/antitermination protein NusA [Candidatus Nealsonbacteria bacterium CG18_big_fil_WC_8_21_14_2_50_37_10]
MDPISSQEGKNIDLKSFASAVAQIAEEKGVSPEKVLESIEAAIAAAYKKDYGEKGQVIKAKLSPETGRVRFWQVKQVLDEKMIYSETELSEMKAKVEKKTKSSLTEELEEGKEKVRFNPEKHIMLEEAKKLKPKIKVGEELEIDLEPQKDYGRIAAQTAKQVIIQKIREAERESIFQEYKSKEGEILSGIVQRIEGRNVFLDIGKTSGILPKEEQVPGEFYRPGQRLKVFVLKIEETPKGPVVFLSRAYPKLVTKLFELEVPEAAAGSVMIKSIAREAGSRSKIAVASTIKEIDPIGAMIGQRGTRVMAVINELGGEKIDIIEYSEEPEKYIANSLSPAKVLEVKIMPKNKALAITPEDQLSLAIGKEGQNVRLAAKLTGWKIDVRAPGAEKEEEVEEEKPETKKTNKRR